MEDRKPFMARWEATDVQPLGSTQIGNDDTGTYSKSSEDNDT